MGPGAGLPVQWPGALRDDAGRLPPVAATGSAGCRPRRDGRCCQQDAPSGAQHHGGPGTDLLA
jgi:hypothetical protein